jgi:hypothetical protein
MMELTHDLVEMTEVHWALVDWDRPLQPIVEIYYELPDDPPQQGSYHCAHYYCAERDSSDGMPVKNRELDQWILEALAAFRHAKIQSFDLHVDALIKGVEPPTSMRLSLCMEQWVWKCRRS